MLKHLKFTVTFPTPAPGKTLQQDLDLHNGLTAITGKNGHGKSLVIEMIQYALFGSAALRGKSEDYTDLNVVLDLQVKGEDYTIRRGKKEVMLLQGRAPMASGTKPVNQAVVDLLGYGIEVFQVGNAANQGAIEALGNMKPTERKKLVDETIGLNILDQLVDFINTEARDKNTTVKTLEARLVAPIPPVKLPGYQASAELKQQAAAIQLKLDERNALVSVAARPLPEPSVEPEPHPATPLLAAYKQDQHTRLTTLAEKGVLEKQLAQIVTNPKLVAATLEEDDAQYETYLEQVGAAAKLQAEINLLSTQLDGLPKVAWTSEQIVEAAKQLELHNRWGLKQILLKAKVPHDCPACNHHWEDADPRLVTEFGDVPDAEPEVQYTAKQIEQADIQRQKFQHRQPLQEQFEAKQLELAKMPGRKDDVYRILKSRTAVNDFAVEQVAQERQTQLQSRLNELNEVLATTQDRAEDIAAIEASVVLCKSWEVNAPLRKEVADAKAALLLVPQDLPEQLSRVQNAIYSAVAYETDLANYKKAAEKYELDVAELAELKLEVQDWENGKKAIADLRIRVKAFLLPGLNKVASYLINEMTGGELSWIVVNEDFEITVEGQRLELLSGAGKAVANLALRLALGQVLTNRVFSVALLDEIDASMDDDRSGYVAKCLRNLTHTIKQVILISHKPETEADQHIRV